MSFPRNPPNVPLSLDDMQAIQSGRKFLVIFGRVDYSDIFGETHWTKFCYEYGAGANQMSPCNKHNGMNQKPPQKK